jgi:outer membrane immunogenic protein
MLKRLVLCAAAVLAPLAGALAADLPNRYGGPDLFSPAPVATWTGFYAGAQLGYAWGSDRSDFKVPGFPFTFTNDEQAASGPVGGVHAGYNFQIGLAVLGVEADVEIAGIEGRAGRSGKDLFADFATSSDMKTNFQGSLRARLGFAMLDRLMLYGTAGVAVAEIENRYAVTLPAGNMFGAPAGSSGVNFDEARWGWTVGAGVEYALMSNWTARFEYRYTNFSAYKNALALLGPDSFSEQAPDFHTVRIGVSYRF